MANNEQLEPCPFCGKVEKEFTNECSVCGAKGPRSMSPYYWNHRPVEDALRKALKACQIQLLQSNNQSEYAWEANEMARAALKGKVTNGK